MKNILLICLMLFNVVSCQTKKTEEKLITQQNNYKNNKEMNEQPIYTLAISVANPHEVYINDMPLIKDYNEGSSNFEIPLNNLISKSGIQTVKIVLLPDTGKSLVDKSGIDYVDIKIYRYISGLSNMSPEKRALVKEINLKEFKELPIVAKEVEFNAIVPYELMGWSKSVDLSKENQETLRNEVVAKYEELRKIFETKDVNRWVKIARNRETELNMAFFFSDFEITEERKEDSNYINQIKKMLTIENYKIITYGGGKIVKMERIDGSLKGESVLQAVSEKTTRIYDVLLHRPTPNAPLEIIR
jgi:hypothetical protein